MVEEESQGWQYEHDGYLLTDCLGTSIFVLKSPYYTHASWCGVFVPGAGYLDWPHPDGPKTYCLDGSWFVDGKAPYPVYSVATCRLVCASE